MTKRYQIVAEYDSYVVMLETDPNSREVTNTIKIEI